MSRAVHLDVAKMKKAQPKGPCLMSIDLSDLKISNPFVLQLQIGHIIADSFVAAEEQECKRDPDT